MAKKKTVKKSIPAEKEVEGSEDKKEQEPHKTLETVDMEFLNEGEGFFQEVEQLVSKKRNRRKNRTVNLTTMSETRRSMLPLQDFNLQYAIGCFGIPHKSIVSLVGPEGIGKSTFLFYLMGSVLRAGGLCYYQETEGKLIDRKRAMRALSTDKGVAKKMLDRIMVEEVHSLRMSEEYMKDWVSAIRDEKGFDINKPIMVCVDTWSKLMSDAEAVGYYDVGVHASAQAKKSAKGIKEGSNLGHASFASDWCRRLAGWLPHNNVILVLAEHQNAKIDMSGTPSYIPTSFIEKRNKTKIGGRAFNQNAALQMIMTRASEAKHEDKTRSGTIVNLRVDKNSYGPGGREFNFEHRDEHRIDTDNYIEGAFIMKSSLVKLLMDKKMFGIRGKDDKYTSEELGVVQASADEVYRAFYSNPDLVKKAGSLLKIEGFYDILED